jgi:hypothetical protein
MHGAGGAADDLPSRAKAAAGGAGDVAERLTERARSVAGAARNGRSGDSVSPKELDRRLRDREKARNERRKALR